MPELPPRSDLTTPIGGRPTDEEVGPRRTFLLAFGSALAALGGGAAVAGAAAAKQATGVFASLFVEKGRIVEIPSGHYDPERKVFVRDDTNRPMVAAMTGTWCDEVTTRCTSMAPGTLQCTYESETDSHPDGYVSD